MLSLPTRTRTRRAQRRALLLQETLLPLLGPMLQELRLLREMAEHPLLPVPPPTPPELLELREMVLELLQREQPDPSEEIAQLIGMRTPVRSSPSSAS